MVRDIGLLVPRGSADQLTAQITTLNNIIAPLPANSEVGDLILNYAGNPVLESGLVVDTAVNSGPFWKRLIDDVRLWWQE